MKMNLKIFAVLFLGVLTLSSCSKKSGGGGAGETASSPDGWELTSWNGDTAIAGSVYLQLEADGTFVLYQNVGNPATMAGYRKFTGTYTLAEDPDRGQVLSGVYSGSVPYQTSYAVELWTEQELQLRSLSDETVSIYARVEIPAYVKEDPVTVTLRSSYRVTPFF